jgi:hypothetical protein
MIGNILHEGGLAGSWLPSYPKETIAMLRPVGEACLVVVFQNPAESLLVGFRYKQPTVLNLSKYQTL